MMPAQSSALLSGKEQLTINWSTSSNCEKRRKVNPEIRTRATGKAWTYDQHANFTTRQAAVAGMLDHDIVESSRRTNENMDGIPVPIGEVC